MAGNDHCQESRRISRSPSRPRTRSQVSTLRMILNALKNAELEEREELSDEKELAVIASYARRIKESIEEFRKGDRGRISSRRKSAELAIVLLLPARADERRRYPPRGGAGHRRYRRRDAARHGARHGRDDEAFQGQGGRRRGQPRSFRSFSGKA